MEVGGRSQQVSAAGRLGGDGKARDGGVVVEKSFGVLVRQSLFQG